MENNSVATFRLNKPKHDWISSQSLCCALVHQLSTRWRWGRRGRIRSRIEEGGRRRRRIGEGWNVRAHSESQSFSQSHLTCCKWWKLRRNARHRQPASCRLHLYSNCLRPGVSHKTWRGVWRVKSSGSLQKDTAHN